MTTIRELTKLSNGKELDIQYPIVMRDAEGRQVYYEDATGFWSRRKYDQAGNEIYYIDSDGYWATGEYDSRGNVVYGEDSTGHLIGYRDE